MENDKPTGSINNSASSDGNQKSNCQGNDENNGMQMVNNFPSGHCSHTRFVCFCCCKHSPKLSIRWIIMFALGLVIGIVGMSVHQSTHALSHIRWEATTHHLQEGEWQAFGIKLGISSAFLFVAVFSVAIWPVAGGSGIPEVMGILKPKQAHGPRNKGCCNILTFLAKRFSFLCVKSDTQGSPKPAQEPMENISDIIKTLFAKFVSCICAVSSGLPVGPEGPMIHMGGLIGDGFGECHSFKCAKCGCLKEKDRLDFISAGVAAGVASAFGAPIGGLLFSIEEMSSSWKSELTWKTFFCCTVASFTTNFFNSFLDGYKLQRAPGLFEIETKFQVDYNIATHILTFIPALILGCLGGFFGSAFIVINNFIRKHRKHTLEKLIKICDDISNFFCKWLCKVLVCCSEPFFMLVLFWLYSCLIIKYYKPICTLDECNMAKPPYNRSECLIQGQDIYPVPRTETNVKRYTCPKGTSWIVDDLYTVNNKSFSQAATLLFGTDEEAIKHLFSNGTHNQFDQIGLLCAILVVYFVFACWAASPRIASGLVVPMLFIGGTMGRIVGQLMVLWFGVHSPAEEPIWAWIDPGAMAVIGAAAFFGGVSRLTVSLTVIMLEITNDTSFLLPLMTAVITSKWVGDRFYQPSLYEEILEETSTSSETEPRIVDGTVDEELQNGQDCSMDSPCDSREEARVNNRSVDEKTSLLHSRA